MAVGVAQDFARQVDLMCAQDTQRREWLEAVQVQFADLAQTHSDSCKDLERERIAGRDRQDRIVEWEHRVRELWRSIDDASFVLVLLDADPDEYIFHDEYYTDTDGGRRAAWDLRAKVKEYLTESHPALAHLPIMIKAVANGNGLSKFLASNTSCSSAVSLWTFAKEFSQSYALSDFVLVSNGKDRADKKITGLFDHFIHNPTCRHIIFGACHDNGYVRTLENYTNDEAIVKRVTLLQSFTVGHEFKKLPFQTMKMENIFRTSSPQLVQSPLEAAALPVSKLEAAKTYTSTTWASLAKSDSSNTSPSTSTSPLSSLQTNVYVNRAGQRIDRPLAQPSQAAQSSWIQKIKKANKRYCRMYQLDGHCDGRCGYSHGVLSDGEKDAYRIDLRTQVCDAKMQCRSAKCHYRHNCFCTKKKCRFSREMHGVESESAVPWVLDVV